MIMRAAARRATFPMALFTPDPHCFRALHYLDATYQGRCFGDTSRRHRQIGDWQVGWLGGVTVTYETIRAWCAKFGPSYAAGLLGRWAVGPWAVGLLGCWAVLLGATRPRLRIVASRWSTSTPFGERWLAFAQRPDTDIQHERPLTTTAQAQSTAVNLTMP